MERLRASRSSAPADGPDHVTGVERPAPAAQPRAPALPAAGPPRRAAGVERQPRAGAALQDLAHHAVPEPWHHPVAVAAHDLEAGLAHEPFQITHRELRLPAREPA